MVLEMQQKEKPQLHHSNMWIKNQSLTEPSVTKTAVALTVEQNSPT